MTQFSPSAADNRNENEDELEIVVRRARLVDVPAMMPLLDEYTRRAEILPRREGDVYQSIRSWVVAEIRGQIVGMVSLLILWADLAEVRSLVVDERWQGHGVGRRMVRLLLAEAQDLALPTVFALTRQPGFFFKLGFHLTEKERLPRKVMKDCVFCPKFHACDEVAVVLLLAEAPQPLHTAVSYPTESSTIPLYPLNGNGKQAS